MTLRQAVRYVVEHEDDEVDDDTAAEVFTAMFGRKPDDRDWEEGLWSHCCAAIPSASPSPSLCRPL